jgi:hypothetical protein
VVTTPGQKVRISVEEDFDWQSVISTLTRGDSQTKITPYSSTQHGRLCLVPSVGDIICTYPLPPWAYICIYTYTSYIYICMYIYAYNQYVYIYIYVYHTYLCNIYMSELLTSTGTLETLNSWSDRLSLLPPQSLSPWPYLYIVNICLYIYIYI